MEELLINNEKISYTLEFERCVGDVVRNLESCVSRNGNVIASITIDDREILYDHAADELGRSLSEIRVMKVVTSNQTELALHTLVTVGEYANTILGEYADSDYLRYHDEIIEGLKLIREGTIGSVNLLKINRSVVRGPQGVALKEVLLDLNAFIAEHEKKYLDEEAVENLQNILGNVLSLIPKIFEWAVVKNRQLFFPLEKSRMRACLKTVYTDMCELCERSAGTFGDIGRFFQIGEDLSAVTGLHSSIELLEETVTLVAVTRDLFSPVPGSKAGDSEAGDLERIDLADGDPDIGELFRADFFDGLTRKLREIERAFRDGDMISVGDELEFEVKPFFETLTARLKKIKDLI